MRVSDLYLAEMEAALVMAIGVELMSHSMLSAAMSSLAMFTIEPHGSWTQQLMRCITTHFHELRFSLKFFNKTYLHSWIAIISLSIIIVHLGSVILCWHLKSQWRTISINESGASYTDTHTHDTTHGHAAHTTPHLPSNTVPAPRNLNLRSYRR